jgi:hypothetical protein
MFLRARKKKNKINKKPPKRRNKKTLREVTKKTNQRIPENLWEKIANM